MTPLLTRSSANTVDESRPVRQAALLAWAGMVLSGLLLAAEFGLCILHPPGIPLLALIVLTCAATIRCVRCGEGMIRLGARGRAVSAWIAIGLIPLFVELNVCGYGFYKLKQRHEIRRDWPSILLVMTGASLMETQAYALVPHRQESARLIMVFDDRVTDPHHDLAAMEGHLERMEKLTGFRLRARILWSRVPLVGQERVSLLGLALGSHQSPADSCDRHELAHAFLNERHTPATSPPTFLVEGWAEAQSNSHEENRRMVNYLRDEIAEMARLPESERKERARNVYDPEGAGRLWSQAAANGGQVPSYLREMSGPFWYHRDLGAVYAFGGAFVDFLIREFGAPKFVELYLASRPDQFADACQRVLGVDVDTLERRFWADVARFTSEGAEDRE
jgi:hypothetical protein